jgi:hypothetical protein
LPQNLLAEGEGFEPSRHLAAPYSFSKAASSATWVPFQKYLAIYGI